MRILTSIFIATLSFLSAAALGGQEFVKLRATVSGATGKNIGALEPISHAYPGETKQFVMQDTDTYYALKWQSLTPIVATMLDEQGGIAEFHQVGPAVFRIEVFNKKKELPTFVFAIVECRPADLALDGAVTQNLLVGQIVDLTPKLVKTGGDKIMLPRSVSVVIKDTNLLQLSDDDGKSWKSSTKVSPGTILKLRALATGNPSLQLLSSGFVKEITINIVRPKITLTANTDKFYQGSIIKIDTSVDAHGFPNLKSKVKVEGASIHAQPDEKSIEVLLDKQGKVKISASVVDGANEPIPSDPNYLEFDVAPKCQSIVVNSMRTSILNGDKVKVELTAFDGNNVVIPRASRGVLKASIYELHRKPAQNGTGFTENWESVSGVTVISTATEDFLRFGSLDPAREHKVIFELDANTGKQSTSVKGIRFVEDVTVVSRLVNDRGPSDLFGPQVAREFHVFELTATNNRGIAEDPEMAKASTVHLYGATLRLPAIISKSKPVKGGGSGESLNGGAGSQDTQTPDYAESTESQIANFARGTSNEINLFLSPYYSERFEKVKDAVNYRDPVNALQRFIDTAMKVATFLQTSYPKANSQPFQTAGDIARLEQAKVVTDYIFNEYKNELSKKGKVGSSEVLREITKVARDQPTVVYFLVRKDTWKNLNGAKYDVTIFPVGTVKISYAVVSETNTTKPNTSAGG